MKTERFSLASATDVAVFDTLVKVIRFDEGNAGGLPVIIKVKSLSGGAYEVEMKPGRQITLPEVTRGVVISNMSGGALSGKITLGSGDVSDNSVVGSVEVIDGGKARTLAGNAFMVTANAAAVSGQYPHVQLLNPAGTGKNIYVEGLLASGVAAGFCNVAQYDTSLGTAPVSPPSKKLGGASGVAQARGANNVAALGSVAGRLMAGIYAANGQFIYRFTEPVCLAPGVGMLCWGALGADLTVSFEHFQEPI